MSALGQKRTFASQKGMSALPPKADIVSGSVMPAKGSLKLRCLASDKVCYRS